MPKNKLNGFPFGHIGASKTRSYEDRSFFDTLVTKGGLRLTLAIVSDGVGGGNLGQRAAELTVESIKNNILNSEKGENEIPQILGAAIGAANKAVYQEARQEKNKDGMSATVSIAAICNDRLFVANVGDSRIYLIKDNKDVTQITVDHTFIEEKIRQGVSPEKLEGHPNANAITRSVGFESSIIVDLGLYLDGARGDGQKAFLNQGMQLNKNDVVLVCSDGLIKESHEFKDRHYVEENEIIKIIKQYNAEQAAKVLVDLAVGRNVDDNVTAVVVEFANRKIASVAKRNRAFIGVFSIIAIILFAIVARLRGEVNNLTQANVYGTNTSVAQTMVASSFTPIPSATPRPTLIPGEIGAVLLGGIRVPFLINTPVSVINFSEIHINHTGELEDGKIYMFSGSKILFETTPADVMNFVVFPGSDLFVDPGRYIAGAGMRIAGAKGIVDFGVSGSCMGIDYKDDKVIASCYEGKCSYQINYEEKNTISEGFEVKIDVNFVAVSDILSVPIARVNTWLSVLPVGSHARECLEKYTIISVPSKTDNNDEQVEPVSPSIQLPPTEEPPTEEPPTEEPPTEEPPTEEPPTEEPPTEESDPGNGSGSLP